ncbi:hypothetical protein TNCV_2360391 [Trichonephila clavipes]|nr:hypothetical protein TNCV_2360391 [Trichonephila clavipes]
MSTRRPSIRLPLTGNHSIYTANSVMKGKYELRNGTTLCLLPNPASACNITMLRFELGDIVVRGCRTDALCIATLGLHPASRVEVVLDFTVIPLYL